MALDGNDPTLGDPPAPAGGEPGQPRWDPATRAYIESLRREAAAHRTENKQLKAGTAGEVRALKIDLALAESPDLEGLDRRYIKFMLGEEKKLDDLDVNAADFREQLHDRISDLVGRHPQVKGSGRTSAAAPRSGEPVRGPGQLDTQLQRSDLAGMTPEQIKAAYDAGRLNAILRRR